MIEIEEKAVPVIVDIGGGEITAEISVGNKIEILSGSIVRMDIPAAVHYIKSGSAEIAAAVQEGTAAFDLNAEQKTADFNFNASDKTDAFNTNAVDKTALIEAEVNTARDWATKVGGSVDGEEYSAKYYAEQAAEITADVADKDLSNLTATGEAKFEAKQDVILDLADIRSGANAGATAVQSADLSAYALSADLATVATSGNYADLSGKPDLSNYVTTNMAQTITATKTFTNYQKLNGNTLKRLNVARGTNPSTNQYASFYITDSTEENGDDTAFGLYRTQITTNGDVTSEIRAFKNNIAGTNNSESIKIIYPASGNPYTYAPAPTDAYSATSGTQIATTGWTASNFVNLAGAQTINGEKTFLSTQWANPDGTTTTSVRAQKYSDGIFYIFMKNSSGNWLNGLELGSTGRVKIGAWNGTKEVAPFGDNTHNLGTSSLRWKQLYAGTTTIATSDERVKQGIEPLPDDVLDAWGEVEFYRYKFNDAVEEKGFAKARYHTGMVAQRIERVFAEHGLNAFEYGLLCYDEWEAEPEEKDESGEIIRPARAAGNRYSLRYEECLCMEAAYQRRRADRIEKRLNALEARL